MSMYIYTFPHLRTYILILERGEGGRERGRETSIRCLLYVPQLETDPET